jgi:hypothetical protein
LTSIFCLYFFFFKFNFAHKVGFMTVQRGKTEMIKAYLIPIRIQTKVDSKKTCLPHVV